MGDSDKRGLSTVITTLIIIILALVAIILVWVVIRNLLQGGSEKVSIGKFTLDLEIKKNSLKFNDDGTLSLTVKRKPGEGNIGGVKFILYDIEDDSYSETISSDLEELEEEEFIVSRGNLSNINKISILPVIKLESGKEMLGEISDTYYLNREQKLALFSQDLISWWKFDEDTGNTIFNNISGKPNGILENEVSRINGISGRALEFDGIDDYVNLGNEGVVKNATDFSISTFIKGNEISKTIFSEQSLPYQSVSLWFKIYLSNNSISFNIHNGTGSESGWQRLYYEKNLSDEKWHHIVGTFSTREGMKLYVDGFLRASDSNFNSVQISSKMPAIGVAWRNIGTAGSEKFDFFKGAIDDLRIYNRVLSAGDIAELYSFYIF